MKLAWTNKETKQRMARSGAGERRGERQTSPEEQGRLKATGTSFIASTWSGVAARINRIVGHNRNVRLALGKQPYGRKSRNGGEPIVVHAMPRQ